MTRFEPRHTSLLLRAIGLVDQLRSDLNGSEDAEDHQLRAIAGAAVMQLHLIISRVNGTLRRKTDD